jgi:Colicin V production protein
MIWLAFPAGRFNDGVMIAAAAIPTKLLFNWFDVALILVLGFGFWRGRRNGMTKEFLPSTQWLVVVIAGGLGNEPLGNVLLQQGIIRTVFGKTFNEKTAAYLSAYLICALAVFLVFTFLKRFFKPKLEGSNVFGGSEYYAGMAAGVIRFACMLIFALALLNAPYYSDAEIQAARVYNNKVFGGGMQGFSGDFFPTLSELQMAVFKDSLTGPLLKKNLEVLLVNSVPPGGPAAKPAVVEIGR